MHPNKSVAIPLPVVGSEVPLVGKMFDLLNEIYARVEQECSIGIAFKQGADGQQNNECRNLLLNYAGSPTIDTGRTLAERLSSVTTHRSGLGLMFLIYGTEGLDHKVILSRFRANNGVLVEETPSDLTVEFIDRVFMKNSQSYKAVAYQHSSLTAGFWDGIAVDKQINSRDMSTSDYWVKDFLASDLKTTSAMGTRRLAIAMRDASQKAGNLTIKKEIASAVTLGANLQGQTMSAKNFFARFGFSPETSAAVLKQFSRSDLADDNFQFDVGEFSKQLPYRTIELDTGAILTADSRKFDAIFDKKTINAATAEVQISTTGKIVVEKLGKAK